MKPPIAEPFGTPSVASNERVFRPDFWRSLMGYFLVFVVVLPPILWRIAPLVRRSTLLDPMVVLLAVVVAVSLMGATINLFYTVEVDQETLQGLNFWWTSKRKVRWNDMTRVRFFWFAFPCAVISTAKRSNFVWLPLFLSDSAGFARAVEELAPPGNPLRLWLKKRGYK